MLAEIIPSSAVTMYYEGFNGPILDGHSDVFINYQSPVNLPWPHTQKGTEYVLIQVEGLEGESGSGFPKQSCKFG